MRRIRRLAALLLAPLLLAPLLLASCRSADPSLYTLAPARGVPRAGAPALVELRRPGIAGYLDRSEIVRANTPYQLQMQSGQRWGEPFGDMVARVLAEDLNNRLPGTSVFTSTGAITADAGARVELDLQRFDADASGQVQLLAQVAVTRGGNRAAAKAQTIRITVTPASSATADYVAALSRALGEAADQIAALLRQR
jgi:uncharacterized lipoprotein YmbA